MVVEEHQSIKNISQLKLIKASKTDSFERASSPMLLRTTWHVEEKDALGKADVLSWTCAQS